METVSVDEIVRLPHGERVKVENIYEDGEVSVRRIEGDRTGTLAICEIAKLLPD